MSPAFFERVVWPWLLCQEGGLSTDRSDRGNWTGGEVGVGEFRGTKYGISAKAYPQLIIRDLTEADARTIYERDYWSPVRGSDLPDALALAVMDCAVNQGVDRASHLLQTALGTPADGAIGPVTVAKAQAAVLKRALSRFMTLRALEYTQAKDHVRYERPWVERLFTLTLECARYL